MNIQKPDFPATLPDFAPRGFLANPHVQTLLNSSGPRRYLTRRRTREFAASAEQWILDGGDGVRLLGYYNGQKNVSARGLIILLHGWEGSSDSNYMRSAGKRLHAAGYAVFRLNLRDHGASHHLNREIFHSCRIAEVVNAVADICAKIRVGPVFMVGFSLGGNFVLRTGLHARQTAIPLKKIVAVCPVITPGHVLDALEDGPAIYHRYFVRKWQRSLALKQACYPDLYDFTEWFKIPGLRGQTEFLVDRYTDYKTVDDYLDGYALHTDRLASMETPATIITSRDDPVIRYQDFEHLKLPQTVTLKVTEHGGHCGFLQDWKLNSWIESFIENELES